MGHVTRSLLAGAFTLVVAPAAHAGQDHTTVRAVRIQAPLKIDGALDEPFYTSVPLLKSSKKQQIFKR